jgi:hypothetical protein
MSGAKHQDNQPRVIYVTQPAKPPKAPQPSRFLSSGMEVRIEGLTFGLGDRQLPRDLIKSARHFAEFNPWIELFVRLRAGFSNYGFRLKPAKGTGKVDADWLRENRVRIHALGQQVWREFIPLSAVLVVWHDDDAEPVFLDPEAPDVQFTDAMGQPRLTFSHGLSEEAIKQLGNPTRERLYREKSQLQIVEDDPTGHHFRVLKRAATGKGFGRPSLTPVLTACDTFAALEAADAMLAHESRRLYKRHLLGHEIRSGPFAGHATHFLKKERAEATGKKFKNKIGVVETADNFDSEVAWDYLPTQFFDEKKFNGVRERLFAWGAPLGQMLVTRGGIAPFLLDMLRQLVEPEREAVGNFMARLVNDCFDPPEPVAVTFSNKVFRDARIAAELLRYGVQTGALSQPTFREEAGFDEEQELANKRREVGMKPELKIPAYDAAHGGPDKGKRNGRPDQQGQA